MCFNPENPKNIQFLASFTDRLWQNFSKMGRNCQFQNSAVTRCAQNSQICETHPHLRNWVECVNSHKLQGPDSKIFPLLKIFTPNAKLGKICHLAKTAGMRNENSAFLSFYNPILRSWTTYIISWKEQGPNAKLLAFFPNSHSTVKDFACFAHFSFCSHFDSKIEQTIKCELHLYKCESEFDSHKCEYSLASHQQINCITKCEIQSINAKISFETQMRISP